MPKTFMKIRDLGYRGAWELLERAQTLPSENVARKARIALLFEEPSSLTSRKAFATALQQMGAESLDASLPLSEKNLRDLAAQADCLVASVHQQEKLETGDFPMPLAIPLVNAGTDQGDPCRVLADILTILQRRPDLSSTRVAWLGEGNGAANSWIEASIYFPFELFMGLAPGQEPDTELIKLALQAGSKIFLTYDAGLAVQDAHFICAAGWNKGREDQGEESLSRDLLSLADPEVRILHDPGTAAPKILPLELTGMADDRCLTAEQAEKRIAVAGALLRWALD